MASGVTMDKVVIDIETNAGKATSGIDSLANSLTKLKDAISGGFNNLNTLSTALEKLNSIDLSSISGNIAKPVKEISKALEPLSEVQGGGFASAVRGLNQLKTAVVGLESIPSSLGPVKEIATAFEPLSNIKSGGFNNVVKGLDNLKTSSAGLDTAASNVKPVKDIASSLRELESIKTAGFNKTINSLVKLKNEADNLGETAGKLGSIGNIAKALEPLSTIKTTGFNSAVKQLKELPTVMNSITPNALENVGRVSTELANKLTPLADKLGQIGNGYKAISALADKYGVSVTKIRTRTSSTTKITDKFKNVLSALVSPFKKVNSNSNVFLNAAQKGFSKLHSKIKQIGLSLLGTRTIFTATRKAVSEYMNMDVELSNQLSNIWRGLGALLAPAIEEVIYIFKQLARVIYSVVKAITGYDLIARANAKATSAWGKSAEDALGSLQKFDDLNVVDFGKGAGDSTDLIDLTEIDLTPIQWIIDAIKKIKKAIEDAFDTGKWRGVGEALSEGFNEFLTKTNPVLIFEKVNTLATNISEVINGWFSKLDAKQLGENIQNALLIIPNFLNTALTTIEFDTIGQKISEMLSGINFEDLIVSISNVFVNLADALQTMFLNVDTETLANSLSQIAVGLLTAINNMLSTIKWDELSVKLHDVIVKMDWNGIFTSIWEVLKSLLASVGDGVAGLLFGKKFESKTASIFTGLGVLIGGKIIKLFGSSIVTKLTSSTKTLSSKLFNIPGLSETQTASSSMSSTSFKVPDVSTVLKGLADLAIIVGGVVVLIAAVGALMEIPYAKEFTTTGLNTLVEIFTGLGKIMIPLLVVSAAMVALGTVGIGTVAQGFVGFALVLDGTGLVVAALGALLMIPNFGAAVSSGLGMTIAIFEGLSNVMGPIAIVAAMMLLMGLATPAVMLAGLAGLALVIDGTAVVLASLGLLSQIPYFDWLVGEGGELLAKIGTILGDFVGSIVAGFADKATEGLPELGTRLSEFMTNLQPFLDGISGVDESTTNAIKNLAEAILVLTAANLLDQLTEWITGSDNSLSDFALELVAFGPAFAKYADSVKGIDTETLEKSTAAAKALADFADALPNHGGWVSFFTGDNTLSFFATELEKFGPAFANYYKSVKEIDSDVVKTSADAASSLSELEENLPDHGGMLSWFKGDNTLYFFAMELEKFGPAFKNYYDSVKEINPAVVARSSDAAKSLAAFSDNIPDKGGLLDLFTGTNTMASFGEDLKKFGNHFKAYYNTVKTIKVSVVNSVTEAIGRLVTSFKIVKDNKLNDTIEDFGKALKGSASNINKFFENTFTYNNGWSLGNSFGKGIGAGVTYALKNNVVYPTFNLKNSSTGESLSTYRISAYATGGYPERGQYFYARENGIPELVGSIGSQTAVANNTQIITGIKQGVKEAIQESDINFTNVVNVGNKTLYKEQQSYNKMQNNKYGTITI